MKYEDIYNFEDLQAYCKTVHKGCKTVTFAPTSPLNLSTIKINGVQAKQAILCNEYSNPTRALNYRLFNTPVTYYAVVIKGIIFSYDTPIGIITYSGIMIIQRDTVPFTSTTSNKLITILNRNLYVLTAGALVIILKNLGIDLGRLENVRINK